MTSPGIPKCTEQFCLLLVVPDTNYNQRIPVLIGTNILDEIEKDCKAQHGEQYLQRANLKKPWYITVRCLAIRLRELKKNKNRIAIVRSAETTKLTIGPNQSISVKGYLDKQMEFNSTCAIIQECEDSTLPDCTTNSVTISPKAILGEVQPVTVDESVFEKTEKKTSKKIFEEIHIDSKLTSEQNEQVESLLKKHIDVFSKHDADIGDCNMIRHRIDLKILHHSSRSTEEFPQP